MRLAKYFALMAFSLLILGSAFAVPGIPHQFYGYVTINSAPADGAGIVAKINGIERASTSSINGNYGLNPSIFYVEDPNSSFAGKTIEFFLNGTSVATHTFENGKTTRLDLYIGAAPSCGDGICNLDEDTTSCAADCGTGAVCGDGTCDTAEDCSSCAADCGACAPFCGDGTCNGSETCSTCAGDCGACGGGAPLGGGGSGGGGGGGTPALSVKIEGNCIGQPVVVSVLNTAGNPAKDARVLVRKGNATIGEQMTPADGKVSFVFEEKGDYTFFVTKNLYTQSSKTLAVKDCTAVQGTEGITGGVEGTGAAEENLCANVNCNDNNPCTIESCVAGTGHCVYENQPDGFVCSEKGVCNASAGVCEEPVEGQESDYLPTGFFGLNGLQGAGAGLLLVGLLAGLALVLSGIGKKKKSE
jgi:hypothetical protein